MTLEQLGKQHGTDKGFHRYLGVYASHLDSRRESVREVLEIGVKAGASLKMWRDYFPLAQIHGLDIDPACNRDYGERISVVTGSQDAPESFEGLPPLDLVVDDGGHVNTLTLAAWGFAWPLVRPDGLYVIEDLGLSYDRARWKWPGMRYNKPDLSLKNDRRPINLWLNQLVADLDQHRGDVAFLHHWPMLVVMAKR